MHTPKRQWCFIAVDDHVRDTWVAELNGFLAQLYTQAYVAEPLLPMVRA